MQNLRALLMGSAAIVSIGVVSESAQAQSTAFGAGATFPQIVYRQTMDCLYGEALGSPGKPVGTGIVPAGCPSFNYTGLGGKVLYAATGSGNGKLVHRTNWKGNITAPSSSAPPYTSTDIFVSATTDYDGVQFAGSDDVFTSADLTTWTTSNVAINGETGAALNITPQAAFGNPITIPTLLAAVGIGFNGKDGNGVALNILPATPAGGSSGLNLTRQALCGIVAGYINVWNHSLLTASNGGVLGTGTITFIHRQDGSGTSFLLSNALATQCQFETGPSSNVGGAPTVSYAFPWTDRLATCPTGTPKFLPARGSNLSNWPTFNADAPTFGDQCSQTIANPGGGTFLRASGSSNLVNLVGTTNGAIGYASADFWLPVRVGGLKTANVQSQWDLTASTGKFQPPNFANAAIAMAGTIPQMNSTTRANPLTWSLQAVAPNPVLPNAYPITGFTFAFMYQCYKAHANTNNSFFWYKTWLDFIYGTDVIPILNNNGTASVPAVWQNEIFSLFNDPVNGLAYNGAGGSGCAGKVGAY